jgi:hypothetical protein
MLRTLAAFFITLLLANAALAQQIRAVSGTGAAVTTAIDGSIVWVGTAPTTWAVTLPANPNNGTTIRLATDTTLTTLVTVTASSGDTLVAAFASQTLTANTTVVGWQYYAPTRIWYRIQ